MPFAIAFLALEYPQYHFLFFLLVLCASLTNDLFFFFSGRFGRERLAPHMPRLFAPRRLQRAQEWFDTYGIFAFISGRFIPFGAGNSVVIAAGISPLALPRFFAWTLISCLLYALIYFYGTFWFGSQIFSSKPALALFVAVALFLTWALVRGPGARQKQ